MHNYQELTELFSSAFKAQQNQQWHEAINAYLQAIDKLKRIDNKNFIDQLNLMVTYHFLSDAILRIGNQQQAKIYESMIIDLLMDASYQDEHAIFNPITNELANLLHQKILNHSSYDSLIHLILKLNQQSHHYLTLACEYSLPKLFEPAHRALQLTDKLINSLSHPNLSACEYHEDVFLESPDAMLGYEEPYTKKCDATNAILEMDNYLEDYSHLRFFKKAPHTSSYSVADIEFYHNEENIVGSEMLELPVYTCML